MAATNIRRVFEARQRCRRIGGTVTDLTRVQRKRVKAAFRSFSGADLLIDYGEWKAALGIKNDFLAERIFELVDADGTGFIDFDEFLAFAERLYSDDKRKRLDFIFRVYDLDDDGRIDKKEITQVLQASLAEQHVTLTEDMLKRLVRHFMRRTDVDRDGSVSRDEFVDVLAKYPGIDAQFSIYAAGWLNRGNVFRSPGIRAARFALRVQRFWQSRRCELLWGAAYIAANAGLFAFAMQSYADAGASLAVQVARGAGACLNLNLGVVLLPMCRSLWTWVRRTRVRRFFPLDSMVEIHRSVGSVIGTLALLHVSSHLINYWETGASLGWALFGSVVGVTGVVTALVLVVMIWLSRSMDDRRHEVFVVSHLLYAGLLVGLLYHAASLWMWLAPSLLVYTVDAAVRVWRKNHRIEIIEMKPLANGVTRLRFKKPKNFDFHPGDYLRLHVPQLSRLQWHPFTISAAPEASTIGVHVRNNGDWTGALHNLSRKKASDGKTWAAKIDGPYATPSSKIDQAPVAVLIAAGIGVTPFASVLQSIVLRHGHARRGRDRPRQKIYFHWLNRSQHSYEWFTDLLTEAEETLGRDKFKLYIHLTSLTHDLTNIAMQVAMDSYHGKHDRDPITGLAAETSAGRPDWDAVFGAVAAAHPDEPVDVFFCGPPALGEVVRKKCRKHGLLYHEERF